MKKIIVAFDGLKYSSSAAAYAIYLARQMKAHLVGVFLEDFTYTSYKIYDLVEQDGPIENVQREWDNQDREIRKEAVHQFETACQQAGLNHSIHHDKNIALQELLHESIFADLLVIDGKETLTHYHEGEPTHFIRDLLADVHCPVLVVPSFFTPIEQVVLLYDGLPSSVSSIKSCINLGLFPVNWPVVVLSVKHHKQNQHLPDNRLMKEFMKRHYPHAAYRVLNGHAATEVMEYLSQKGMDTLVVLGAYGRNAFSRWVHPSLADALLRNLSVPLLIAHNQ